RANEGSGLWLRLDPERRAPDGANTVWNTLFAGNAMHPTGEGREVMIEGESPAHLRTNRLDGNGYVRHRRDDWRTSTFYLHPVVGAEAGFRGSDLRTWQRLTGSDAHAVLLDASPRSAPRARLVPPVDGVGAPAAPLQPAPRIGAGPELGATGRD
ncbi:MAG TPA: hypothetical protein VD962_07520, partial [Rubricoccaceae bacterium]|nr:hypothetical protein [Rubricoccaceae bacterium]